MTFHEFFIILEDFILTMTMPGAKDGRNNSLIFKSFPNQNIHQNTLYT